MIVYTFTCGSVRGYCRLRPFNAIMPLIREQKGLYME